MSLEEKIKDILCSNGYDVQEDSNNWSVSIIENLDPNDRYLDTKTLKSILESDDPESKLYETVSEMSINASNYVYDDLYNLVRKNLDEDVSYSEISSIICEHCTVDYDIDDLNQYYCVNIMLDTGDANTDFSSNNVLNYYGDWSSDISEPSSILWLAEQFGKKEELKHALTAYSNNNQPYSTTDDGFIESIIQELENNSCSCSSLTFLVKMKLFDLFSMLNKTKEAKKNNDDSYFTLNKKTMCGLFDGFHGGGSVLSIELPSNIKIPYRYIHSAHVDGCQHTQYDVQETYGLCQSAWQDSMVA